MVSVPDPAPKPPMVQVLLRRTQGALAGHSALPLLGLRPSHVVAGWAHFPQRVGKSGARLTWPRRWNRWGCQAL